MKKVFLILLIGAAGYITYEYLIKEKQTILIKANKVVTVSYSMDADAPSLYPHYSGFVKGTVKNVTDKTVTNISLKYKLDGILTEAQIYSLEPGEVKNFSTQIIEVRTESPQFFLEEMTYE